MRNKRHIIEDLILYYCFDGIVKGKRYLFKENKVYKDSNIIYKDIIIHMILEIKEKLIKLNYFYDLSYKFTYLDSLNYKEGLDKLIFRIYEYYIEENKRLNRSVRIAYDNGNVKSRYGLLKYSEDRIIVYYDYERDLSKYYVVNYGG